MRKTFTLTLLPLFLAACNSQEQSTLGSQIVFGKTISYEEYEQKALEKYGNAEFSGNAKDINRLGIMYDLGFGVPKNLEKAKQLYLKAGKMGYGAGYCNLAILSSSQVKTYRDAFKYYELASLSPEKFACGFNGLGVAYNNGLGVKPNLKKAEEYFLKAVEYDRESGDAEYNLALMAQTRGNQQEAQKWFKAARQKGFDNNRNEKEQIIKYLELEE